MPHYTVTFRDDETAPDKVKALAEQNGIDVETQLKRLITIGLAEFYPPERDISDYDNLEDFLVRGGHKK
jgi:hypothetical protein